jgi:hypothetical protein
MIKRLIKKLKKLQNRTTKDEYVQYGMCPGIVVWTNNRLYISGHMYIKKSDSNEQIKDNLIKCVSKICKDENLTKEQTIKTIDNNLKSNGLI